MRGCNQTFRFPGCGRPRPQQLRHAPACGIFRRPHHPPAVLRPRTGALRKTSNDAGEGMLGCVYAALSMILGLITAHLAGLALEINRIEPFFVLCLLLGWAAVLLVVGVAAPGPPERRITAGKQIDSEGTPKVF